MTSRGELGGTKLTLPDVTVCAADCLNPRLAARALERSLDRCGFGDAILFSDRTLVGPFRCVPIPGLGSMLDYSRFILRDLHRHIRTDFVLIVQWDGYVVDPQSWTDEFLEYDYIGAVWPHHPDRKVGNGGFSLRSRRLLDVTATALGTVPETLPEDVAICQHAAPDLEEKFGIRFAPPALARRFSHEGEQPGSPTFGFHGFHNMLRHETDEVLLALVGALDGRSLLSLSALFFVLRSHADQRWLPLAAVYGSLRVDRTTAQLRALFAAFPLPTDELDRMLLHAETLIQGIGGSFRE